MTDGFDDKEALAAEYVLGTLDDAERTRVRESLDTDAELAGFVNAWTQRLAPLNDGIDPVAPSASVLQLVEAALDRPGKSIRSAVAIRFWQGVGFWRLCTAGAGAAAVALALILTVTRLSPDAPEQFVASLTAPGAPATWLAAVDLDSREVRVEPVGPVEAPPGRSLELWLITAAAPAPRSLGLIDPTHPTTIELPSETISGVEVTLAISLEPDGGSPTGSPTGPVLYQGKLLNLISAD